jgi:LysM repeat protein
MKHNSPRKWFILILILGLALSACERPVPRPEVDEDEPASTATPDTTIIVPTAPGDGEETGYPPPGDGEEGVAPTASPTAAGETGEEGGEGTVPTATPLPPTATPAPATGETTYTVVAGDTLYKIAQRYGLTVQELAAANDIVNVNDLDVGQVLTIPAAGAVEVTPVSGEERVHIVQPGENLFRIGLQYGFTVDELAEYNNLANPNDLEVGQEIRIPPAQ